MHHLRAASFSPKYRCFSDAVATAGMQAEEEEVKYQWPDSHCHNLHLQLLQPHCSAAALNIHCPSTCLELMDHLCTDLSAGWDMPWKTMGSHLSWKHSCPKIRRGSKFCRSPDLTKRQIGETPFGEWVSPDQALHWGKRSFRSPDNRIRIMCPKIAEELHQWH